MGAIERERAKAADRYVLLSDVAAHLNLSIESLRKRLPKIGIKFVMVRHQPTHQWTRAISVEDAKRVIESERNAPTIISVSDLLKE